MSPWGDRPGGIEGGSEGGRALMPLLGRYFARFDEGELTRWVFRGLMVGAIGVLALDLQDLAAENGWWETQVSAPLTPLDLPLLPPAVETDAPAQTGSPRPALTLDEAALRQPMRFTLEAGGVLRADGSIDPGAADRFAAEIAARGEYVRTISLNSPGGALDDAIAMAVLVRDKGLSTIVEDGAICASSCPLLMAGGKTRSAGEDSAIGVHQFYAVGKTAPEPAQAMSDAQATTARISRHLAAMGVDAALWLHALDTPPRALYYFSAEELSQYRLVTQPAAMARKTG